MMSLGQKKESLNYLQYLIKKVMAFRILAIHLCTEPVYARLGMTDKSEEIDKLKQCTQDGRIWRHKYDTYTATLSDNAEYQSNAYRMYELALKQKI